eukprot:15191618-Alexandrium_andersonii.AAC.1
MRVCPLVVVPWGPPESFKRFGKGLIWHGPPVGRAPWARHGQRPPLLRAGALARSARLPALSTCATRSTACLLYTSDAADDM